MSALFAAKGDSAERHRCEQILRYAAATELFDLAQTLLIHNYSAEVSYRVMMEACESSVALRALQAAQANIEREALTLH
jgi:hypothetical protein